jgi:hypothetical protein
MMAAMLETCPRREEKTNLFACIFLQRLPREIRVLLARVDHNDPKELAKQADELWALHDTNGGGGITAVQQNYVEGDFVAAVQAGDRQRGGSGSRGHGRGGGRRRGSRGGAWTFLLAKVDFAILGADFLKHFHLVVELVGSQLLDTRTLRRFAAGPPAATDAPPQSSRGLFAAVEAMPPVFRQIFSQFQDVANAEGRLPPAKHKTLHHIKTTGPPATARFRRLDAAKLAAAKGGFCEARERRDY